MKVMERQRLAGTRGRFDRWRKSHGGRGRRIPEVLWNEAVCLAREEGLRETARALGLRAGRLERRMGDVGLAVERDGGQGAGFVELTGVGCLGGGGPVVELISGGKEQMRIHLGGAGIADLLKLAEAFWSRRS